MTEMHNELHKLTCDEYMLLLSNDMDQIESIIKLKENLIVKINKLDITRTSVIKLINTQNNMDNPIRNVSDLLGLMKKFEAENGENTLRRYNDLLIDIIQNIQAQNKKNQMYLNKAIVSIQEMKNNLTGKKGYQTYTSLGKQTERLRK